MATWQKDVETVLTQLGGKGNVSSITDRIKVLRFFSRNGDFSQSVRTTLNSNRQKFKCYGSGLWGLIN